MAKRASTGANALSRIRRVETKAHADTVLEQIKTLKRNHEDEVDPHHKRIRELEAELAREKKTVTTIDRRYARVIESRADLLRTWAVKNRSELTAGTQTVMLAVGKVQFRLGTVALTINKQDEVIASLRRARLVRQFVRMIPQIDIAALRQRPEVYGKLRGLTASQLDRFSIIPSGWDKRLVTVLGSGNWSYEPLKEAA